ncbi:MULTISPECIES: DnaJ domain-containing protein [unclassified Campylobacter]|uniref:DnaJ domain-containing protein n=1 Tax=unclassified Campylobacter TaxID=2593542 RepID=UPI001237EAE0|nr:MULTISPECIES: DnaJ domain-containing protein [unclassified Campylobacter]KAA6224791.1 molecular chaperone DjiA [Campylobacter sp. LR185c]KAA6227366.1 molecular chaperone DjiA [Campylobacter sp. LR196d]KAA6228743.1 molecular chaperone DjiA [Campylobacter sp. LR286c]KAA6229553.1 molecular chaperone DjiA [Campylobacter sp. LR264d]KAA6230797.1 molecular chaperone DjiA [Campylobacter sp. LR291e]
MIFIILLVAIFAFYYYYKTWGKEDFSSTINKFSRGAKGFARDFSRGVMEERIDEFRRRVNYYVIALLAKIAKSDGRVSEEEADMIAQLLNANAKDEREREFLKRGFNEHKENLSDVYEVAREFIKEVPLPKEELFNILKVLVFMALIDSDFSPKKQELLNQIARAFSISQNALNAFINELRNYKPSNSKQSMDINTAYGILNLDKNASIEDAKKAYRRLAKQYHPDVLNANKVSDEQLKQGVLKFQQINEAYELLKKKLENR